MISLVDICTAVVMSVAGTHHLNVIVVWRKKSAYVALDFCLGGYKMPTHKTLHVTLARIRELPLKFDGVFLHISRFFIFFLWSIFCFFIRPGR